MEEDGSYVVQVMGVPIGRARDWDIYSDDEDVFSEFSPLNPGSQFADFTGMTVVVCLTRGIIRGYLPGTEVVAISLSKKEFLSRLLRALIENEADEAQAAHEAQQQIAGDQEDYGDVDPASA